METPITELIKDLDEIWISIPQVIIDKYLKKEKEVIMSAHFQGLEDEYLGYNSNDSSVEYYNKTFKPF